MNKNSLQIFEIFLQKGRRGRLKTCQILLLWTFEIRQHHDTFGVGMWMLKSASVWCQSGKLCHGEDLTDINYNCCQLSDQIMTSSKTHLITWEKRSFLSFMTFILLICVCCFLRSKTVYIYIFWICLYVCLSTVMLSVITGCWIQQIESLSVLTHVISCAVSSEALDRANTITHCISNDRSSRERNTLTYKHNTD